MSSLPATLADVNDWKPQFRPAQVAFADAIASGVLSDRPGASNYAGDYMYMHTQDGRDGFKHHDTRRYVWSAVPVL